MYAIVGSGFGLYGYLPAVLNLGEACVALPESARAVIATRPELRESLSRIRFEPSAGDTLAAATVAILAVPPDSQPELATLCASAPRLEVVFLEKPIGRDPASACDVLALLRRAGKRYRVGYTLLHTTWHSALLWPPEIEGDVHVHWTFMAHHFHAGLHNWKREHSRGGGVLRFYGIHLIACLAYRGYDNVSNSELLASDPDEPHTWRATFYGAGLPSCRVEINTRAAKNAFRIACGGHVSVDLPDPFALETSRSTRADPRVAVLERLLDTARDEDAEWVDFYARVNDLWLAVEKDSVWNSLG